MNAIHYQDHSSSISHRDTMSQRYDVSVAHFGHPQLRGAKHWAIVILTNSEDLEGQAYQVEGSTNTYSVKQPEEIKLLGERTYMGSVKVGRIHTDLASRLELESLHGILMGTPVVLGNTGWNCQNWVISGLERLRNAGHTIDQVTLEGLQYALAQVKREDQ